MAIHQGSLWIDRNWNLLPQGVWVAANANGIVSEWSTYNGLIANVTARGIPLPEVAIVYVPSGIVQ